MDTGLFEALPDGLVIVDAEGRIVRANARAHAMFGYAPDSLVGMDIEALMPSAVRARHRHHRKAYASTPRVRPMGSSGMTLVGERRDGEQFPVEIALSPVAGEGPPQFLASVRDISETLRAQQALIRARYDGLIAQLGHEALEARSMHPLVDRLPHRLLATLEGDLEIGLCLRRLQQRAEWVSTSHPEIGVIDADTVMDALGDDVPLVGPATDARVGHLVRALPDGTSCALVPLVDRGQVVGALAGWAKGPFRFDHDVIHLLRSTATLVAAFLQRQQSEEQLAHAQRLDSLGQLTGGIAHDFNNLLTVMSGCLQLIAAEPGTPAASNALIESALRAVHSGAELTDKLLSIGRRQQLRPTAIDIVRLLGDIKMLLERTIGGSIALRVAIAPGTPNVWADASQLDAALVNLALNARDAMPDGGEIRFSASEVRTGYPAPAGLEPGRYVVFAVEDSGSGMPADVAARAIEPFFSTKGTRGSGLGLSMVYGFVQQSGGGMSIHSAPGAGTRVELLLPAADAAPDSRAAGAPSTQTAPPGKALVVEDEDAVRAIAAAFMRSFGYEVIAVEDFDAALALLDAVDGAVDIVFSDLMLGNGPDGMALADVIRRRWPAVPFLLTSGHAHGIALSPSSGIEMLAKPYDRERLAAAVAACRSKRAHAAQTTG